MYEVVSVQSWFPLLSLFFHWSLRFFLLLFFVFFRISRSVYSVLSYFLILIPFIFATWNLSCVLDCGLYCVCIVAHLCAFIVTLWMARVCCFINVCSLLSDEIINIIYCQTYLFKWSHQFVCMRLRAQITCYIIC